MCGITGIFSRNSIPIDRPLIEAMNDSLKHRGPDAKGIFMNQGFALGHRRLSIIDLEKGQQPLANEDASVIVILNGEIYNYVELKKGLIGRGHQFKTASDTEVIVHLYEEKGKELFTHLNGMFALAIVDLNKRELLLARDRLGKKPLFYYLDRDWAIFGSELKALMLHPAVSRGADHLALYDYLSLNYIPGERTILKSVKRVLPGSWLLFSQKDTQKNKFWSIEPFFKEPRYGLKESKAIEELDCLLTDAVRLRLRSDVPVGIFLSGGIDSSLVAWKAKELKADICGYNANFREKGFSEAPYAKEVAAMLGMELKVFEVEPEARLDFKKLVYHADDPLADSSCFPYYLLCQDTSKTTKVVLGGDGGDELFAGYLTYPATLLASQIRNYFPPGVLRLVNFLADKLPVSGRKVSLEYKLKRFTKGLLMPASLAHFSWNGTWGEREKKKLFCSDFLAEVSEAKGTYEYLAERYNMELHHPTLANLLIADQSEYLVNDILAKADRMSMAHGLEVRSPWLDYRIVEWAAKLPPNLKLRKNRIKKYILRRFASRKFSANIVNRSKQGFSIPIHDWMRGSLLPLASDLLSPESIKKLGFLNQDGVNKVFKAHLEKRGQYGFELWGLMVLVMWHRLFNDGGLH